MRRVLFVLTALPLVVLLACAADEPIAGSGALPGDRGATSTGATDAGADGSDARAGDADVGTDASTADAADSG